MGVLIWEVILTVMKLLMLRYQAPGLEWKNCNQSSILITDDYNSLNFHIFFLFADDLN